jgi:hypothetical protein
MMWALNAAICCPSMAERKGHGVSDIIKPHMNSGRRWVRNFNVNAYWKRTLALVRMPLSPRMTATAANMKNEY